MRVLALFDLIDFMTLMSYLKQQHVLAMAQIVSNNHFVLVLR